MEDQPLTASELGRRVGLRYGGVVRDIQIGILTATWSGSTWMIDITAAEEYIRRRERISRSISTQELERRTKKSERTFRPYFESGELPTFRHNPASKSSTQYILEEDARAFCQKMGWEYSIDGVTLIEERSQQVKEALPPRRKRNVTPLHHQENEKSIFEHKYVLRLTNEEWELWQQIARHDGLTKIDAFRKLLRDEGRRKGYLSWPGRKQQIAIV